MSLILDALKRAEQERKLGQPPEAVQMATMSPISPPAQRDGTLVIVMAVLLLAAAIVIAALLLRSHRPAGNEAAAVAAQPTPADLRPIPPQPTPPRPAPAPAPTAIADRDSVNNLDDVVAADDGKAENAQAAQVAQGRMPADAGNTAAIRSAPTHLRASTRGSQVTSNPDVTVTSDTPGAVVEENRPAEADQDSATASEPQVPPLRQMPESYRDAFPQLSIDVHAYNDDPEHRFIIVGGNTYHEGSSLPQGPQIIAITPDGVVFEWQGQRVLYALGTN